MTRNYIYKRKKIKKKLKATQRSQKVNIGAKHTRNVSLFRAMYLVVTNIPESFRTPDLRNYFSLFIERGAFNCFHFRHRPCEQLRELLQSINQTPSDNQNERGNSNKSVSSEGDEKEEDTQEEEEDVSVAEPGNTHVNETRNTSHWLSSGLSGLSSLISEKKKKAQVFKSGFEKLRLDGHSKPGSETSSEERMGESANQIPEENTGILSGVLQMLECAKGTCCVLDVKDSEAEGFIEFYSNKHFVDREGNVNPMRCLIHRLDAKSMQREDDYLTRKERNSQRLICTTIADLIELHPPPLMPQGSIGTPTDHFKSLIRSCQLPGTIIKKLGLEFPRSKGKKRFGQVPFDYGTEVIKPKDTSNTGEGVAFTASGHLIPSSVDFTKVKKKLGRRQLGRLPQLELQEEEEDGAEVEEWERYETFHNDVTSQDRTKERLYEKEIELVWEKGGPGLVFYTDAQVWREQEGDFDEQTADEWDVDMSIYYEKGAGDKDAQDSVRMVQSNQLRSGHLTESAFKVPEDPPKKRKGELASKQRKKGPTPAPKIGEFEAHTRGFGRRLMEAQGWEEGKGLGRNSAGLPYALDNDGQHPHDKKGFGYYGEKLQGWGGRASTSSSPSTSTSTPRHQQRRTQGPQLPRHSQWPRQGVLTPGPAPRENEGHRVRISTVFDRPQEEDPPTPSLRTHEPTTLSYRHNYVPFTKASEVSE
ncbi:G patch domain-containing protein 3-like [Penaeus japonicus]|uniref:G patch domain-containing protein 3-like n=1 Tax=Penaeus japonicus TaxID=27405 RepID=UPI001C711C80|nr:G patch domain-containing protein 3-like [Penaeus japonicus]